jgi:hypothetical protein
LNRRCIGNARGHDARRGSAGVAGLGAGFFERGAGGRFGFGRELGRWRSWIGRSVGSARRQGKGEAGERQEFVERFHGVPLVNIIGPDWFRRGPAQLSSD